ncbi:MAG TPA: hypothetical protein VEP90_05585, partial [Methylomirabilota bacterium]|nr:hypothetical protein [Methylomirabilota bacterium]
FVINQQVICIAAEWFGTLVFPIQYPKKGEKYTIRSIFIGKDDLGQESPSLHLNEIHNPPCNTNVGFMEQGFDWRGFKPLDEKTTDISDFYEILKKIPQRISQKELTS